MKFFLIKLVFCAQIILFKLSFYLCKVFLSKSKKSGTIIGTEEIASLLYSIGAALNSSKTVNTLKHPYYSYQYDFDLGKVPYSRMSQFFLAPVLFGYLIHKYKNFVYISRAGFLLPQVDGREFEFKLLKKNNCNIICFFTGSDIRSLKLMSEYSKENNIDVLTSYLMYSEGKFQEVDDIVKKVAQAADNYASVIFNASTDQMSYIGRKTHPFLYFASDDDIYYFPSKFQQIKKIIVHAPSSPILKGTPLVRATIKKLQEEGYDFEYVELIGQSNDKVLAELRRAHIVLNQFYAFVPGVFGIEALMNNTVLLTSADGDIESSLFGDANEAWVVTPYWKIYDKLKEQLDKPMEELKIQADKGTDWVKKYASYSFSSAYMQDVLNSLDND